MFFILYFILEKNQLLLYNYDNNGMVIAMRKNGFIISTTLYGIFGIMMITVFYILYILGANRTLVNTSTAQAKKGIETYNYDKVYVNFLGSESDLNSKVSDSNIDELVKKLESKNIYMEYDKSFTSTETIDIDNDNVNAPFYQNIILKKIYEYKSNEEDDNYYYCSPYGDNSEMLGSTIIGLSPNGSKFLGVTKNGYIVFMEIFRHDDRDVEVTYIFIDKNDNEKRFTIRSTNEKILRIDRIGSIRSFFNQSKNDSVDICMEVEGDYYREYNKIITLNYNDFSYETIDMEEGSCDEETYEILKGYSEESVTPLTIHGEGTKTDSVSTSCNNKDICVTLIDDLDKHFLGEKLYSYANSSGSIFVNSNNSNLKRYGDVIAIQEESSATNDNNIDKCNLTAYMVWYPPKYSTITSSVKVFNLTNSNKDPNTQYQKQYYVFVSQDNKDALGISRIEFNDTLNNTLNKAINTRSLLFSDNPTVFPVTNNVSTYEYNSNVLDILENQIIDDLG